MKRILLILSLLVFASVCLGQTSDGPPVGIFGSENPELIPPEVNYRMMLIAVHSRPAYADAAGMTGQATDALINSANAFYTAYQADHTQGNELASSTISVLRTQISGTDSARFDAFLTNNLDNIVMSPDTGISAQFTSGWSEDPNGFWEWCWDDICIPLPLPFESAMFVDGVASCNTLTMARSTFLGGNLWASLEVLSGASKIASAQDGTLVVSTSTNKVYSRNWHADISAFAWDQFPDSSGITISEIAISDRAHIYALDTAGKLYQYNGTHGKFELKMSTPAMQHIAAASQGPLTAPVFTSSGANLYQFTGSSYFPRATAPANITHLAVSSAYVEYEENSEVYWTDSANNVYVYLYNGVGSSVNAVSKTGITGTLSGIAAALDRTVWAFNTAHAIFQKNAGATSWTAITGKTANQVAIGSQFDFYVLDTTNRAAKFYSDADNTQVKSFPDSDGYISVDMFSPITNIAPGVQFTGRQSAKVTQVCPGQPPAVLLNTGWLTKYFEIAWTRFIFTGGPPSNCHTNRANVTVCDWNVDDWCTSVTTPPDFNVPVVTDETFHHMWDNAAACFRTSAPGPWWCSRGVPTAFAYDTDQPKASCTRNP